MAAVQIEQEDLDEVAATLEDLVAAISEIDTTVLPDADQTRLQSALTSVTNAVNSKLPVDVSPGDDAVTPPVEPEE